MINVFRVRPRGLNIGNALIDLATARMLRQAFGDGVNLVPIPATATEEEGATWGLTARSVHEMNQCGQGVVIGGGNLYENGRLAVDVHALSCLAPPLLLWSLSYGRIYDGRGRLVRRTDSMPDEVILALHRRASASLARDQATLVHLRDLGAAGVVLAGCPTVHLAELVAPAPWTSADPSGTLVSIRSPSLMSVPQATRIRVHDDVRRLVAAIEDEGPAPVRLLCHDRRDLEFAATFGEVEYVLPDDVWSYLELLRRAALVVSFRLHATVPCLGFGTPVVNISYDERSLSLVRTLGLGEWDIDLLREEDVVAAVLERLRRLSELTGMVAEVRPVWERLGSTMRSALDRFADEVLAYAGGAVRAAT